MNRIKHAMIAWAFVLAGILVPKPVEYKRILPWCQPALPLLYCIKAAP